MSLVDSYTWGAAKNRDGHIKRICDKYEVRDEDKPKVYLFVRTVETEVAREREGFRIEEQDAPEIARRLNKSRIEAELDRLGIPHKKR